MNYGKKSVRKKQKSLNAKSVKWGKKLGFTFVQVFLVFLVSISVIGACAGIGVFRGILATAPDISNIDVTPTGFSTFVYDIEGHQTAKLVSTDSNRIPVSMDMIPENLEHAFVAIEDERFYMHNGIDIKGIIRAGFIGIKNKFHFSEGASTITQQLLKNNVFTEWTSEKTDAEKFKRKIQEQYLALELEKVMDKDDILINYMNSINLGQNTLGVQAASMRYFNKSVSDLTLSECAVIASITQSPTRLNPITNPENNAERRAKVLKNMLDQGYITQAEYDEAIADDVYARIQINNIDNGEGAVNTYFVDALTEDVLDDLVNVAGYTETQAFTLLYSGGLKIYSTQDPYIQSICDEEFSNEDNFPANTKWYLNYKLTVADADGNRTNYSTEMFREFFKESNKTYNLIYSSTEAAYADIELYKEAVMGPNDEVIGESISLTPQPQVSLVVMDQHTGYVVAMVGGRGAKTGSRTLNRATDSTRQPGSTFKVVST
ncbi:MAG: transglycosylase domain-containing protein, partial [Lachnospiraceae bacterium]|nr:transglycosylase domain-containing protein [Lachnospiraceae bacterium]